MYKTLAILWALLHLGHGQTGMGPPCVVQTPSGATLQGACVTVDQDGHNWACRDIQGWFYTPPGACADSEVGTMLFSYY
jgi:hypothetical protein